MGILKRYFLDQQLRDHYTLWDVAACNSKPIPEAIRLAVRIRARGECENCEQDGLPLVLHHRYSDSVGAEMPGDVEVLCEECHDDEHDDGDDDDRWLGRLHRQVR